MDVSIKEPIDAIFHTLLFGIADGIARLAWYTLLEAPKGSARQ